MSKQTVLTSFFSVVKSPQTKAVGRFQKNAKDSQVMHPDTKITTDSPSSNDKTQGSNLSSPPPSTKTKSPSDNNCKGSNTSNVSKVAQSNTKKRKRVIEEEEDEFIPVNDQVSDDDVLEYVDMEAEFENSPINLSESEDEPSPIRAKSNFATTAPSRAISDTPNARQSLKSSPTPSPSRRSLMKSSSKDLDSIDAKILECQSRFDTARHEMFSEKIVGRVERERDRMMYQSMHEEAEGSEGEEEEIEAEDVKKSTPKKSTKSKYTPLEQQYLDIKKNYEDTVLFVESGYRYKFFGKDAEIASKVLNIRTGISHNFLCTSVPVHRLHVHALRLVQAGFKVGVVSQTETAALKAISTNKSGPFSRAVSALYTKSTLVGESMDPLDSDSSSLGQYLMAVFEDSKNILHSQVDKKHISMVAVKTSTGEIIYDEFEDTAMRSELETRLRHIDPIEIVANADCSSTTKSFFDLFVSSKLKEDAPRIEYLDSICYDIQHARGLIQDEIVLLAESAKESSSDTLETPETPSKLKGSWKSVLKPAIKVAEMVKTANSFFQSLSLSLTRCFGSLAHYLKNFGLSSLICLNCNFKSFISSTKMLLDGNTLNNLELITNQQTGTAQGSLLGVLDRTCTSFGKRRLISWIRQPLVSSDEIKARLDAVEELTKLVSISWVKSDSIVLRSSEMDIDSSPSKQKTVNTSSSAVYSSNTERGGLLHLLQHLAKIPDLERGICRIFYNKCSIFEFVTILSAFRSIQQCMPQQDEIDNLRSPLLRCVLSSIPPELGDVINYFLDPLNISGIDKNSKSFSSKQDLFIDNSLFPEIAAAKAKISKAEQALKSHLKEVRRIIGKPSLEYVTKNKEEYVIELTKAEGTRAPEDWIPLAGPKTMSRFHTPCIVDEYQELLQGRELLSIASASAWMSFISAFVAQYNLFRSVVDALATLDCLYSFSMIAKQDGYVKPHIVDIQAEEADKAVIQIEGGRHPVVEQLLMGKAPFVPNHTYMGVDDFKHKVTIITGPNMGGKTCYTRQVAIICIMAQMGCYVPCHSAAITPLRAIYTRMGAYDSMSKGRSTFFVEIQETADILKAADEHSLVILDELGRGTSTHDGFSIAYATLHYLIATVKCFTLFVTHYPALAQFTKLFPNLVKNYHIAYLEHEPSNVNSDHSMDIDNSINHDGSVLPAITFLHKLVEGSEGRSFGLNVARLAHLPPSLIETAYKLSTTLETKVKSNSRRVITAQLLSGLQPHDSDSEWLEQMKKLQIMASTLK